MLERYLVQFCYATLAGIKTGSLFSGEFASEREAIDAVRLWNEELADKGVCLVPLRMSGTRALIYVYRKEMLNRELSRPEVAEFLTQYDYDRQRTGCALRTLKSRFEKSGEFPHEIGVFLGYPLGDVKGFIENKGKNCKCTGCWKVYCDKCKAEETFARFKRCKREYLRLWKSGRSIQQLTVKRSC